MQNCHFGPSVKASPSQPFNSGHVYTALATSHLWKDGSYGLRRGKAILMENVVLFIFGELPLFAHGVVIFVGK